MKFRSNVNYQEREQEKEKVIGESETIPGESLTIRELLQKHVNGIAPPIGRQVYYEEEPDIDNPDITRSGDFDLTTISDSRTELEALQERYDKQERQRAEKRKKAEEKHLKELQDELTQLRAKAEPNGGTP